MRRRHLTSVKQQAPCMGWEGGQVPAEAESQICSPCTESIGPRALSLGPAWPTLRDWDQLQVGSKQK